MGNKSWLAIMAVSVLMLAACDEGNDTSSAVQSSTLSTDLPVAFSVAVGFAEDASPADTACKKIIETLSNAGAAANCTVVPVHCQAKHLINPGTKHCVELRGIIAQVADQAELTPAEVEERLTSIVQTLQSIDEKVIWPEGVTYVLPQGHSQGKVATALFMAMRSTQDQGNNLSSQKNINNYKILAHPNAVQAQSNITVSSLKLWDIEASVLESGGFERKVYAPGFTPGSTTVSDWALYGLQARVKNGEFKCLRGYFRNLNTNSATTVTDGDCSDIERSVILSSSNIAAGLTIKISEDDVKGLSLANAQAQKTVDINNPVFLKVPGTWQVDGKSDGKSAPEDESLVKQGWPYGIAGVGLSATKDKVSALTVYFGTVSSEPAPDNSQFYGHLISTIETATVNTLNAIYDTLVDDLTFAIYPNCSSTLSEINFCNQLSMQTSYDFMTLIDGVCKDTCDFYYDSCQASKDACKIASLGLDDCDYNCGKERDKCYEGCSSTLNGSVEMKVQQVTGLEDLQFTQASVPMVSSNSLVVDTQAKLLSGVQADLDFRICFEGSCSSFSINNVPSGPVNVLARGIVTPKSCGSNNYALNLSIDNLDLTTAIAWDTDDLIKEVEDEIEAIFGDIYTEEWLEPAMETIFEGLEQETQSILNQLLGQLEGEINKALAEIPIIACP